MTHLGRRRTPTLDHDAPDQDEQPVPQPWDDELDDLMGRTVRAYDLVVNYERESEGGHRWSRDGIAHICKFGEHLHDNLRIMRRWQRAVADVGKQDRDMMSNFYQDAEKMRDYCEEIQCMIREKESQRLPVDEHDNIFTDHGVYDKQGRLLDNTPFHGADRERRDADRARAGQRSQTKSPRPQARR